MGALSNILNMNKEDVCVCACVETTPILDNGNLQWGKLVLEHENLSIISGSKF